MAEKILSNKEKTYVGLRPKHSLFFSIANFTTGGQTGILHPIKLKFFGILGLLTLIMPLDVVTYSFYDVFYGITGVQLDWHFFCLSWFGENFKLIIFLDNFWGSAFQEFIVILIGFVLVLLGSILLLLGKRWGGILLIGSIISWIYPFFIRIGNPSYSYLSIPLGALVCLIVGILSLIHKRQHQQG